MANIANQMTQKEIDMIVEVIQNVRKQQYTPETLCQLQKIIETKYYYWWIMDMKKEEWGCELFKENLQASFGEWEYELPGAEQALEAKWVNKDMQTMHMGHQPLVWLIDENHARGIFQYEDSMCYFSDNYTSKTCMMYCDDFEKDENGVWHITALRMCQREQDNPLRLDDQRPADWRPEGWTENY